MAGWPNIDRSEDRWLAESLSSDGAAAARLYDLYAARLFDYCHVLLRDERAAAQAVLDALLAIRRGGGDPHSFRGRLYALAREASMSRGPVAPAERRRAAEAAGDADQETRRLVHAALLVLGGRQREILDLSLRHGLGTDGLAQVMRTSPDDVASSLVRARGDLDDAFAAALLVRAGRDDCPSVASLAGPAGRPLDGPACKALVRHAAACPICGTHADAQISTARLLGLMPVAAIPGDLRERFLAATSEPWFADAGSPLTAIAEPAAEPVAGHSGRAGRRASRERRRTGSRLWPVAAGVAFATVMAGGTFYALSGSGSQNTGNDQAIPSGPGDLLSDAPSPSASGVPLSSRGSVSPTPTPSDSSGTPTPEATPTPGHSTPGTAPVPVVPSPPTQAPPPPPAPGTLLVSGCSMGHGHSCTITVTASGGPVSWGVTGTSGGVSAGGGGYLNAGESAGVTASRRSGWCWGHHSGSVSFSSGAVASVDWTC